MGYAAIKVKIKQIQAAVRSTVHTTFHTPALCQAITALNSTEHIYHLLRLSISQQLPFISYINTKMFARATRPLQRSLAPLGDRILIRKAVKETKTAGGILLPTDNAKESNQGTVVAVGPGLRDVSGVLHAPTLKAGDTVLLPQYGGTEIEIGDEKLNLFREDDILGKFE